MSHDVGASRYVSQHLHGGGRMPDRVSVRWNVERLGASLLVMTALLFTSATSETVPFETGTAEGFARLHSDFQWREGYAKCILVE